MRQRLHGKAGTPAKQPKTEQHQLDASCGHLLWGLTLRAHGPGGTDPAQFLTHACSVRPFHTPALSDQWSIFTLSSLGTLYRTLMVAIGNETPFFFWKTTITVKLPVIPLATTWGKPA